MSETRELDVEIYVQNCPLQIECQKDYPGADVSMALSTCLGCDHYWGECIDPDEPINMTIYCTYPEFARELQASNNSRKVDE